MASLNCRLILQMLDRVWFLWIGVSSSKKIGKKSDFFREFTLSNICKMRRQFRWTIPDLTFARGDDNLVAKRCYFNDTFVSLGFCDTLPPNDTCRYFLGPSPPNDTNVSFGSLFYFNIKFNPADPPLISHNFSPLKFPPQQKTKKNRKQKNKTKNKHLIARQWRRVKMVWWFP